MKKHTALPVELEKLEILLKRVFKMRSVDDEVSQLACLVDSQMKERQKLIDKLKNTIDDVTGGDFGHISIDVCDVGDRFHSIKIMTQDSLGFEEIRKLEKVLEMENSWNTYNFYFPED